MESVPAKWRGVLSGLLQEGYAVGFLLAAVAYYGVFPHLGGRGLFIIGGLPALLVLFIRGKVKETDVWREARADWETNGRATFLHWRRVLYPVLAVTLMHFISLRTA